MTVTVPPLSGRLFVLEQSTAFLLFLVIDIGVALGVLRYRLFALADWSVGVLFYAVTQRESKVLELIARGLRNSEVATQIRNASTTVAGYIKIIYRKPGIGSQAEAARHAAQLMSKRDVQGDRSWNCPSSGHPAGHPKGRPFWGQSRRAVRQRAKCLVANLAPVDRVSAGRRQVVKTTVGHLNAPKPLNQDRLGGLAFDGIHLASASSTSPTIACRK